MNKHDKLTMALKNKLKGMEGILVNHEYWNARHNLCVGEIDLFSYRGKTAFITETKTNYSEKLKEKAISQMIRAERKFLPKYEKEIGKYFSKIVYLFVTPGKIECMGVTKR